MTYRDEAILRELANADPRNSRKLLQRATREFDERRLIFHESGLLAIDKPAGLPVHVGTGHAFGLSELLQSYAARHPRRIDAGPTGKVPPLHRLDREATGVILFGLAPSVRKHFQEVIAAREVTKRYLTFVGGPVDEQGELRGKIRSKLRGRYRRMRASLNYRRICGDERLSLVEVTPHEGYTHQIRSLFADAGRPVAGDLRYGKPKPSRQFLERFDVPYLLLHARELDFPPGALPDPLTFLAPIPDTFGKVLEAKGWNPEELLETL